MRAPEQIASALFAVLVILLAVSTVFFSSRRRARLERVGEPWRAYAAPRGLTYTSLRGYYHVAPSLGSPPTLRGTIEGVPFEIAATEARGRPLTFVSTEPPAWFPNGGRAWITKRDGTPSWLVGTVTRTGDPVFDDRFSTFAVSGADGMRFAGPELRRRVLDLGAASHFMALSCDNASGNRRASACLRGHVVDARELDAAVALLLTIHRG